MGPIPGTRPSVACPPQRVLSTALPRSSRQYSRRSRGTLSGGKTPSPIVYHRQRRIPVILGDGKDLFGRWWGLMSRGQVSPADLSSGRTVRRALIGRQNWSPSAEDPSPLEDTECRNDFSVSISIPTGTGCFFLSRFVAAGQLSQDGLPFSHYRIVFLNVELCRRHISAVGRRSAGRQLLARHRLPVSATDLVSISGSFKVISSSGDIPCIINILPHRRRARRVLLPVNYVGEVTHVICSTGRGVSTLARNITHELLYLWGIVHLYPGP